MISRSWSVVIYPWPSLSYTRKASLSSAFMVSSSGSSTKNLAQSWQNSPNSISPEPSSSISSKISFNSSLLGRKPMPLRISSKSSADKNPWSLKSNILKQIFRTLISSFSRPQDSLIPSKSIPSYVSSFLEPMLIIYDVKMS